MKFFVALMLACVLTLGMANAAEENVSQQEQLKVQYKLYLQCLYLS